MQQSRLAPHIRNEVNRPHSIWFLMVSHTALKVSFAALQVLDFKGMAAPAIIDNLPAALKRQVIDALMAGEKLVKVAAMAGVSSQSMSAYRKRVILPAMKAAMKVQSSEVDTTTIEGQIQAAGSLARDVVRSSLVRERVNYIWETTCATLTKAANADNIAGTVSLISSAHENIKLLGTLTGELQAHQQDVSQNNVNIILGIPRSGDTQAILAAPRHVITALPAHDAADVSPDND